MVSGSSSLVWYFCQPSGEEMRSRISVSLASFVSTGGNTPVVTTRLSMPQGAPVSIHPARSLSGPLMGLEPRRSGWVGRRAQYDGHVVSCVGNLLA